MITLLILSNNTYFASGIKAVTEEYLSAVCVQDHDMAQVEASLAASIDIDCVIVDSDTFPSAVQRLAARWPVVCLPLRNTKRALAAAAEANCHYIPPAMPVETLIEAIQAAAEGNLPSPNRTAALLETIEARRRMVLLPYKLTPRETEALLMIADGFSNRDIADAMGITVGGLRGPQRAIYVKLHVNNRTEAMLLLARLGIL